MKLIFEAHLTEEKLTQDFLAGLKRRYLSEKYFYWFPLSVKAWLDLCNTKNLYKNYSRSYQLISSHAREIAETCCGHSPEVLSLGAGQGDKELVILRALESCGKSASYRPLDSSQSLLEMALANAATNGGSAYGVKADLEDITTYQYLQRSAREPRLFLVLGNTLGIMDPIRFLSLLNPVLRTDDLVLLDGEIFGGEATMKGYDHPTNRQFAFGPLATLGLEEGRDGALVFESLEDPRRSGLFQVSKHFAASRPLRLSVAGERIELGASETIRMNPSWKYSENTFRAIVRESGGLEIRREFWSDDRRFVMALASPARRPAEL